MEWEKQREINGLFNVLDAIELLDNYVYNAVEPFVRDNDKESFLILLKKLEVNTKTVLNDME